MYHVVFCPKYRHRILTGEIARTVASHIEALCRQKEGLVVVELNVRVDHVHVILEIPPKYAVSAIMGYLKGKLAIRLMQQYEPLAKRSWGRHLWARGYCVSTVGLDEEKIRKYVRWQEAREREIETQQARLFD
jgi:putative transposase